MKGEHTLGLGLLEIVLSQREQNFMQGTEFPEKRFSFLIGSVVKNICVYSD